MSSDNAESNDRRWLIHKGQGPVLATAVHAGHEIREDLHPYLAADDDTRRREEDPITDIWATAGDHFFTNYVSRFEVDLNRPREKACTFDPKDTWGLQIWRERPPQILIDKSLKQHERFYQMMALWIEELIDLHGNVLVLDIHSYNHRRNGPDAPASPASENPEIDLGLTTMQHEKFAGVANALAEGLKATPYQGNKLDVRENVRYPDGGNWPEWIFANYSKNVCTITLEYKKFYMDEWTAQSSLPIVEDLRAGLCKAVGAAKEALSACPK
ncbi:N-formylglutamate amidohydrolase [Alteromonas sp. ASW11-130]|uniref:N-formylglutamate amidohydrolase n=1 Tax=Alteromonas sp. ASW11-130 TaxID=3015775 RepID=UPI002242C061|nr:N-formylglutamate amidohydrolase [Alteromonas sp. ASW11-130]MCW8090831.1 N-formylglutamate amidohydrolase [Alteromonas sp. ASW11-130]